MFTPLATLVTRQLPKSRPGIVSALKSRIFTAKLIQPKQKFQPKHLVSVIPENKLLVRFCSNMAATRPKFLIDTDCGIDDAQAILMALTHEVDVVGITCVSGNCEVDQVCVNVMKVLELVGRTEVPVYKGAEVSLMGDIMSASHFHGMDGLGDVPDSPQPDMSLLKTQHAVQAMIDTVNQAPGEITLVALAPLTNIALAMRMDPGFAKKLKKLVIMGGTMHAKGNVTATAEFNFACDVEAAHVVLKDAKCPTAVVTWEGCMDNSLPWEFFYKYLNRDTATGKFLKKICQITVDFYQDNKEEYGEEYICCDPVAMIVALQPDCVLEESNVYASVELGGAMTRGQMVVDWNGRLKKEPNIQLIKKVNLDTFKAALLKL